MKNIGQKTKADSVSVVAHKSTWFAMYSMCILQLLVLTIVPICASVDTTTSTVFPCPNNFTLGNGTNKCYLIVKKTMDGVEAQNYCSSLNAHLAFIESEDEQNAVVSLWTDGHSSSADQIDDGAWIGGCRVSVDSSTFVWTSACFQTGPAATVITLPMNYTDWYLPGGEPNNFGYLPSSTPNNGEWCVEMSPINPRNFQWNDLPCSSNVSFAICEATIGILASTIGPVVDVDVRPVIIGSVVGAVLLILLIIVSVAILSCRSRSQQQHVSQKHINLNDKVTNSNQLPEPHDNDHGTNTYYSLSNGQHDELHTYENLSRNVVAVTPALTSSDHGYYNNMCGLN